MAGGEDELGPLLGGLVGPEQVQFRAVGGEFPHGDVVKRENVGDKFFGLAVKDPFLAAPVDHHLDLFLADLLLVGVGVDAQQTEDQVGGGGEDGHHRGKDLGDGGDEGREGQGQGLRLFHAQALGDQLPEHQGKVGQQEGDEHHGQGVQGGGREGSSGGQEQTGEPVGEIVRGKGAAQKARKGDGDLNGRQKLSGPAGEPGQAQGPFIPLGHQLGQLVVVHGDHGDLRAGEDRIERDED